MKNVGDVLSNKQKTLKLHDINPNERRQLLAQEVKRDPEVRAFFQAHKDELSREIVNHSMSKLYEFVSEKRRAREHKPLKMPNYTPQLVMDANAITVKYVPTEEFQRKQQAEARYNAMKLVNLPKDLHEATFENFDTSDRGRQDAQIEAMKFKDRYLQAESNPNASDAFVQSPYLYGSFGIGKTYLMAAIANALADHGVETTLVHFPQLVTNLRNRMNENALQQHLGELIACEVLAIDDIGAENNTAWVRDDVLGVILQARMSEHRATLFTSNFSFEELEDHFAHTKNTEERVKARRLMERIRYFAKEVPMTGRNRRHD